MRPDTVSHDYSGVSVGDEFNPLCSKSTVSSLPGGMRSAVMSMYVCLSVCPLLFSKTARPNVTNFYACRLWPWLDRSSRDCVAIRYELPVLWMTSYFHTMGPMGRIKHDVMFKRATRWRYQLDVRQLQFFFELVRMWNREWSLLSMVTLFNTRPTCYIICFVSVYGKLLTP